MAKQKPARVMEAPYTLVKHCPVCSQPVEGIVTVEMHLGDLSIHTGQSMVGAPTVDATATTSARIRSLVVTHRCSAPEEYQPTQPSHPDEEPAEAEEAAGPAVDL